MLLCPLCSTTHIAQQFQITVSQREHVFFFILPPLGYFCAAQCSNAVIQQAPPAHCSSCLMIPQAISQSNEGEVILLSWVDATACLLCSRPQCGEASLKTYTETEQMAATAGDTTSRNSNLNWLVQTVLITIALNTLKRLSVSLFLLGNILP